MIGSNKFYTWLDVSAALEESLAGRALPEGVSSVDPYHNELTVYVSGDTAIPQMTMFLADVFGSRFHDGRIVLDSLSGETEALQVDFVVDPGTIRPSLPLFRSSVLSGLAMPPRAPLPVPCFAFYSFKGGVGRTTHLLGMLEAASRKDPSFKALVVDLDLEAPGITWLAAADKLPPPALSVIDVLALWHARRSLSDDPISAIGSRIIGQTFSVRHPTHQSTHYYIPAFRYDRQLLTQFVTPESLVRSPGDGRFFADILSRIAHEVSADVVLVDLRAGTNELSAPLLLDDRIDCIIVTTDGEQSVAGTELTLRVMREHGVKRQPEIVFSFRSVSSGQSSVLSDHEIRLLDGSSDEMLPENSASSPITSTQYSEELLSTSSLSDVFAKLSLGVLGDDIAALAERTFLRPRESSPKPDLKSLRERVASEADRYEFAESGAASSFLPTSQLRALAQAYSLTSPAAVVLGQKGSGKTYTYLQLARNYTWGQFAEEALSRPSFGPQNYIWPLMQSVSLLRQALQLADSCALKTAEALGIGEPMRRLAEAREFILHNAEQGGSVVEWRERWFQAIVTSLGIDDSHDRVGAIVSFLLARGLRLTIIIDGLEDVFQSVATAPSQQVAIRSLLQNVVAKISEVPNSPLGIVIFSRADIARSAVSQNFGQFAKPYESSNCDGIVSRL